MIVGSAAETAVPERIATNIASRRPEKASMTWRWDIGAASAAGGPPAVAGEGVLLVGRAPRVARPRDRRT